MKNKCENPTSFVYIFDNQRHFRGYLKVLVFFNVLPSYPNSKIKLKTFRTSIFQFFIKAWQKGDQYITCGRGLFHKQDLLGLMVELYSKNRHNYYLLCYFMVCSWLLHHVWTFWKSDLWLLNCGCGLMIDRWLSSSLQQPYWTHSSIILVLFCF